MLYEKDYKLLAEMKIGDIVNLYMFEEGGVEIRKTEIGYELYEIPRYGGDPMFYGNYENIGDLISVYTLWT